MTTAVTPNGHHEGRVVPQPVEPATPMVEIASLKPSDEVEGLLACVNRRIVTSPRTDLTFLVVVLRDRERKIEARAFTRVHELAAQFDPGDIVHVQGRLTSYHGEAQIRLEQIARHEAESSAEFLPVAYRDVNELEGFLEHLAGEVGHGGYRALLESLLGDAALRAAWRTAPCTPGEHHAYLGGLLEHTVAVAMLAVETCPYHPKLNGDLLLTAAITHDLGLTQAFTYTAEIAENEAGRMLGHVELGLELVREHARRARLSQDAWLPLAHCILTHHGAQPRAAAGGAFACAEALALQRLVAVDEGIKAALDSGRLG